MVWAVSLSTMELSPHSLTPAIRLGDIRSLVEVSTRVRALAHPVLYRRQRPREASPKAISGRTSYFQV